MSADPYREEVINAKLAELLVARGADARAETIVSAGGRRRLPDLRVSWAGVRIAIECKFDEPGAAVEVDAQVDERLVSNLASVGIAVLYPPELRTSSDLRKDLTAAPLRIRVSAIGGRKSEWFVVAGAGALISLFAEARGALVAADAVAECALALGEAVAVFQLACDAQPGRDSTLFGIVSSAGAASTGTPSRDALDAARAIAGLAVATAALLQVELAKSDPGVPQLPEPTEGSSQRAQLIACWNTILEHNYTAVFQVAREVLLALGDDAALENALGVATNAARLVSQRGVIGRHDLIGRVYHALLSDRKFLATYYTSVPAATLLCRLGLTREAFPAVAWNAEPEAFEFRLGDFACGTGTLLTAAAASVRENWAAARAETGASIDLPALGRRLIEHVVYGYDVLAYAVQMCATTLLLGSPGSVVTETQLHQMPLGTNQGYLGSLELLTGSAQAQLFGSTASEAVDVDTALGTGISRSIGVPELDFVIMNPPFTRSVGGSQLLGSLEGKAFAKARERLSALANRPDVDVNLNAGLGGPFVELAARAVRPGGRLALVLPKTVLTGEAWGPVRRILSERFHLESVVTSHEADHWNFSDSTELSEALLVARRVEASEDLSGATTEWIALRRNPRNAMEALGTAAAIERARPARPGGAPLLTTDALAIPIGEVFSRPVQRDSRPWRHATFSTSPLDQAAEALLERKPVPLPRAAQPVVLPVRRLGEIAQVGPDRRDVHDGFETTTTETGYPGWWGHDAQAVTCISQSHNIHLRARTAPAPGRARIKDAAGLWAGAGSVMLAERLWLLTHRVTAVHLGERALSNTWWPLAFNDDYTDEDQRLITLYLNSTLGMMAVIAIAEETRGPWIAAKKNKLAELPLLDPHQLSASARKVLVAAWDRFGAAPLQPFTRAEQDDTRVGFDNAICAALGIDRSPIDAARTLLAAEPRLQPSVADAEEPEREAVGVHSLF